MSNTRDLDSSLRLAREAFAPSLEQRERVRAALAARAVPGGAASTASPKGGVAKTGGYALAVAKGAALIGVGFALGYWFSETRAPALVTPPLAAIDVSPVRPTPPVVEAMPSNEEPAVSPPNVPAKSQASGATAKRVAIRRRARGKAGETRPGTSLAARVPAAWVAPAADPLTEELGLLQRADRALRSGDGALARSFVRELEARFPNTAWQQERSAIWVLAACALDEPDAKRDARVFLEQHAGSVYFDRIRALCRLDESQPAQDTSADGSRSRGH